jgi:hypothetical protein
LTTTGGSGVGWGRSPPPPHPPTASASNATDQASFARRVPVIFRSPEKANGYSDLAESLPQRCFRFDEGGRSR